MSARPSVRRAVASALAAWDRLAPRERTLVAVGAGLLAATVAVRAGLAVRADFARLAARVDAAERDLAAVRALAARLGPPEARATAAGGALVTRLERAAETVVGRARIAAIGPADDARPAAGLALRVADASLAEAVRLLHALQTGSPPLAVTRLDLARHADDPGRFTLAIAVAAPEDPGP